MLVIDDDPTVHDLLQRVLEKHGFRICSATNAEDGLKLANSEHPLAIIVDIMMPGMDGWAVLRSLKENAATAGLPVIMSSMLENEEMGIALGASDYLTKPVDRDRLLRILDGHRIANPQHTILVIDDDDENRRVVLKMLRSAGCQLVEASNGIEGLEQVEAKQPDLILLDLMMPEMDGFEFVTALRHREVSTQIPIVVLTAKDMTKEDHDRMRGAVSAVRQKGTLSREQLLEDVVAFLRRSQQAPGGDQQ